MAAEHVECLQRALGALSRGDYISALQLGLRAAKVPKGADHVRCDAYLLLALSSLELGAPEDALAFAIGAHLAAVWSVDQDRQEKATSMVSLILTQHPTFADVSSFH
jgi:hypothetical protein